MLKYAILENNVHDSVALFQLLSKTLSFLVT